MVIIYGHMDLATSLNHSKPFVGHFLDSRTTMGVLSSWPPSELAAGSIRILLGGGQSKNCVINKCGTVNREGGVLVSEVLGVRLRVE